MKKYIVNIHGFIGYQDVEVKAYRFEYPDDCVDSYTFYDSNNFIVAEFKREYVRYITVKEFCDERFDG